MENRTPSLAAETEVLREAYAALNRRDILAFVALLDPQIERIEPADFPGGGASAAAKRFLAGPII
jgi:hypothetical protein